MSEIKELANVMQDFKSMNLVQILQCFCNADRQMSPLIRTQRQIILQQIFQFEKINKSKLNVTQTQEYLDKNI